MLNAAAEHLREARSILTIRLWGPAGRAAFMAAPVAARGYIFQATGQVVKTHRGTHNSFYRTVLGDTRFDAELRGFLSRAYALKDVTDYGIGPARDIAEERARGAIETAARFVALMEEILSSPPP